MLKKTQKTLGILGGMGPEATVDLLQRIIRLTPATVDEDHIRCIVDLNPKVPSRIKALIDGDGVDPTSDLVEMAQGLEHSGADVLAIACNTAHHYLPAISQSVKVPVISMIDCVINKLQSIQSGQCISIIGAPMIKITGLFEEKFNASGFEIRYPDEGQQLQVFAAINAVKAGLSFNEHRVNVITTIKEIIDQGADSIVIACTELSVLLSEYIAKNKTSVSPYFIDTAEQLAIEIVRRCLNQKTKTIT